MKLPRSPVVSCQYCESAATIHVTDISDDILIERHACERHACEQLRLPFPPFLFTRLDPKAAARLRESLSEARTADDPVAWLRSGLAVPALVGLLTDRDASLRYYAAAVLGHI